MLGGSDHGVIGSIQQIIVIIAIFIQLRTHRQFSRTHRIVNSMRR
jgi:hypothetical protein